MHFDEFVLYYLCSRLQCFIKTIQSNRKNAHFFVYNLYRKHIIRNIDLKFRKVYCCISIAFQFNDHVGKKEEKRRKKNEKAINSVRKERIFVGLGTQ